MKDFVGMLKYSICFNYCIVNTVKNIKSYEQVGNACLRLVKEIVELQVHIHMDKRIF